VIAASENQDGFVRVVSPIAMGRGTIQMLQVGKGIFGAVAISLMLGAVQFASGQDLTGRQQISADPIVSTINRAAKADRGTRLVAPAARTQTISLRLQGLSDTSVLVRIPAAEIARSGTSTPSVVRSGGKTAVACEPVVSILTEVAKQLEPGRCVT
jgi:hypothetical protein